MLLYLSLFTILLTAVLAVKYGAINRNSLYLFSAFFCFALYELSHYFLIYSKNTLGIAIFYNHFSSLNLLIGPFLYFYIRGTITDHARLHQHDFLHFMPAGLHLLGTIPWIFKTFSDKYLIAQKIVENIDVMKSLHPNIFFTVQGAFILRPLSILVYLLFSFFIIWKYSPAVLGKKNIPLKQYLITYRWLLVLLGSVLLLVANYAFLVIYYLDHSHVDSDPFIHVIQSICGGILILPTSLLFIYPRVLLGFPIYRSRNKKDKLEMPEDKKEEYEKKEEEPFKIMAEQIQQVFATDLRVMQVDFSLEDLANTLHQPVHHVSYCINHVMLTKFTDLRLFHRISYAKKLLLDSNNQNFTIESIARQAGFKTRSNFYNAFKQITGKTPTEFIRLNEVKIAND